jgi:prepilin-type N-terminal cleavage/methylation domain-containing protein/prepilin-type processing-associated H-X9-DG protein
MLVQTHKRGFTLIELLVVIAVIAILASILFPVFAKAQAKAKSTACLANIRQLTTAMIMYAQDNRGMYPKADSWAGDIEDKVGNRKLFTCPLDDKGDGYISYGMNSVLFHPDGTGIKTDSVTSPSEVAMYIDATSKQFPDCGIVPSGNAKNILSIATRHDGGASVSYCDGHAESLGGKNNFKADEFDSPIARALYYPVAFGWVNNPGGGVTPPTTSQLNTTGVVKVCGSSTCAPILQAAVDAWNAGGGQADNGTYAGSAGVDAGTWTGSAYDIEGSTVAGASSAKGGKNETQIGTDALCLIVNKNCKIPMSYFDSKGTISSAEALAIWGTDATASTAVADTNNIHVWCREIYESQGVVSGTYEYFNKAVCGNATTPKAQLASYAKMNHAAGALEMMTEVSRDPYAIGYMGAGQVDPEKVTILAWKKTDGTVQNFSRANVLSGGWELTRPLYASYKDGNTAAAAFVAYVKSASFQGSPIMKSLFFPIQ